MQGENRTTLVAKSVPDGIAGIEFRCFSRVGLSVAGLC